MTTGTFKAAAVQMRSGLDPERNIAAMDALVAEAVAAGADYVQTPEMKGALVRDKAQLRSALKGQTDDPVVAAASELAARHRIHLHVGLTAIAVDDGKVANRVFLFVPDGGIVIRYDKIHMLDVDLDNGESWRESATYQAGRNGKVADMPFARLGFAICYYVQSPDLFQHEAMAGANVLSLPAAFTRQTGGAHWHVLVRARAIENGAFVVAAAQGGDHEDGRETYGHSLIVDLWGRVLAEADHDNPAVIVAQIDCDASGLARRKIPNLCNQQAFGVQQIGSAAVAEKHV